MPSINKKFVAFMRTLSQAEQMEIVPLFAKWVELSGPAARVTMSELAGSQGDDMEGYAALRQPRARRGP
jgi:hypothetical protein